MKLISASEILSDDYIAMFNGLNGRITEDIRHLRIFKAITPLKVGSADLYGFIGWNATLFRDMSSIDNTSAHFNVRDTHLMSKYAIRVYTNSGYVFKLDDDEILKHIVAMSV